jgi:hypothetical protein
MKPTGDWDVVSVGSELDLRLIQNSVEFLKFFHDYPSVSGLGANLLMWDFNYINGRFYIIDTASGYLHILSLAGDLLANFKPLSITYEKTLAIPAVNTDEWSWPSVEKMVVDYDVETGEERGILVTRHGENGFLGTVGYIVWPEV